MVEMSLTFITPPLAVIMDADLFSDRLPFHDAQRVSSRVSKTFFLFSYSPV